MVSVPEPGHQVGVHPGAVKVQRVTQGALVDKAGLLVSAACGRIEVEDVETDAVQAKGQAVVRDEPGRFGAQASTPAGLAHEDTKIAGAVVLVPLVEDRFAHDRVRREVDDRQHQAGVVNHPLLVDGADLLPARRVGVLGGAVDGPSEPGDVRLGAQEVVNDPGVVHRDRTQTNQLALKNRLVREDRGHGTRLRRRLRLVLVGWRP